MIVLVLKTLEKSGTKIYLNFDINPTLMQLCKFLLFQDIEINA